VADVRRAFERPSIRTVLLGDGERFVHQALGPVRANRDATGFCIG
jgi:hypothetical protein